MTKTQLINAIENLPDNLTIDQVIDRIIFIDKVQKGLDDSNKGRINTKEEAKQKLNKWFK
jgi:predicted transcriptional regulator